MAQKFMRLELTKHNVQFDIHIAFAFASVTDSWNRIMTALISYWKETNNNGWP